MIKFLHNQGDRGILFAEMKKISSRIVAAAGLGFVSLVAFSCNKEDEAPSDSGAEVTQVSSGTSSQTKFSRDDRSISVDSSEHSGISVEEISGQIKAYQSGDLSREGMLAWLDELGNGQEATHAWNAFVDEIKKEDFDYIYDHLFENGGDRIKGRILPLFITKMVGGPVEALKARLDDLSEGVLKRKCIEGVLRAPAGDLFRIREIVADLARDDDGFGFAGFRKPLADFDIPTLHQFLEVFPDGAPKSIGRSVLAEKIGADATSLQGILETLGRVGCKIVNKDSILVTIHPLHSLPI